MCDPERMELLMCDPELKPFIIDEVHLPSDSMSKSFGSGSYGRVELFVVGPYQLKCAGKSIHAVLVEAENEGVDIIEQRFIKECKLMSRLRHPNIVQFLGVCFPHDSSIPTLLMEYMTTSLESFLKASQSIPLSVKISILHDVAQGLAYLHSHSPPVIHRDLTASNVLLNSALSAKIADFGNSRLVDITPDQLAKTLTCAPGTLAYLPPEALNPKPQYDTKLDSFSYGHLALYTMTQVFPMPSAPTFLDPETNKVIGKTEVERREEFLQSINNDDITCNSMKKLVIDSLCNDPAKRPDSLQILSIMQQLWEDVADFDASDECLAQKDDSKGNSSASNLIEVRFCLLGYVGVEECVRGDNANNCCAEWTMHVVHSVKTFSVHCHSMPSTTTYYGKLPMHEILI